MFANKLIALFLIACFSHVIQAQAAEKEKAICLKKMPWHTLDTVTLCDSIKEIEGKTGVTKDKCVNGKYCASNPKIRDGVYPDSAIEIRGNHEHTKIYYYYKFRKYIEEPNYQFILQKIVATNGMYDVHVMKNDDEGWCWGDCNQNGRFSVLECNDDGKGCLVYTFHRLNDGRYLIGLILENTKLKHLVAEKDRQIEREKRKEF